MKNAIGILLAIGCGGCGAIFGGPSQQEDLTTFPFDPADASLGPAAPPFDAVIRYRTTIHTDGDPADIYFPQPTDADVQPWSVALLMQGATVDKSYHGRFAMSVARYGFVVVVPNHHRFPGLPPIPDLVIVDDVLAYLAAENENAASPLADRVDTDKLMLLGYSLGSGAALTAVQDVCAIPFCSGNFDRPEQLLGVVVYSGIATLLPSQPIGPIENAGIPVALIQGDLDGITDPAETFRQIQEPPKALITVLGANHFSITDVQDPLFPIVDPNPPTLDQSVAIETIARWTALFLRAHALDDPAALEYLTTTGDAADKNVNVVSVP